MKRGWCLCSLVLAFVGALFVTDLARAAEITVCPTGTGVCDHATVQAAVDASAPGDVIKVAAGTYTSTLGRPTPPGYIGPAMVTQVVHITQSLTIRGGYTTTNGFAEPPDPVANPTTLDPQQRGRGIFVAGEISVTLEGLRVVNGYANGLGGGPYNYDAGGGMYVVTATVSISDSYIASNIASQYGQHDGGGAFFYNSEVTFQSSTFSANRADDGAGIYLYRSEGLFQNNEFVANDAGWHGGGIYAEYSDIVLEGNTFDSNDGSDYGGGMALAQSTGWVSQSVFVANSARYGGAIHVDSSTLMFSGNEVDQNYAQVRGGGLYLKYGYVEVSYSSIAANTSESDGGGIYAYAVGGKLNHNTVMSNTSNGYGGGVFVLSGDLSFAYNTMHHNAATTGGGMTLVSAHNVSLDGNRIISNTATYGGGLALSTSDITLQNNVIADNYASIRASGVQLLGSSPRLVHNTLARNHGSEGSGIYAAHEAGTMGETSTVQAVNTILISHTVGITVTEGNTATMASTVWGNGTDWGGAGTILTGTHNLWGDPDFADPDGGDYHIGADSIARDSGIEVDLDLDMDGDVRPMTGKYDIGADEYPDVGLALAKYPDATSLNRGQVFTYTVYLTSTGVSTATHVVLTDTLDMWQKPLAISASMAGCALADSGWGGDAVCALGDLAPDVGVAVTLTVQISDTGYMGLQIDNAVVATSNETFAGASVVNTVHDCHVRLNDDPADYTSVQQAVDAASTGDIVKVAGYCVGMQEHLAPAGYYGPGVVKQIVYLDKELTLQGGYTADFDSLPDPITNPTTLDAQGLGRVMIIVGEISPTISGLDLVNGDAAGLGGYRAGSLTYDAGGGVYAKSPATFRDNVLMQHHAEYGGGTFWDCGDSVRLYDNRFISNTAALDGGGALLTTYATLNGNHFLANHAGDDGGGILLGAYMDSIFERNTFESNTAVNRGGGLFLYYSYAVFNGNTVISNSAASDGGGIYLYFGDISLQGNEVISNSASDAGGGLYLRSDDVHLSDNLVMENRANSGGGLYLESSDAVLTNTLVAENRADKSGSGLYIQTGSPRLLHTTVARNWGGDGTGIFVNGWVFDTPTLSNTIIVSHTAGISVTSGQTMLEATLWGAGVWANGTDWGGEGTVITGTTNLWGDPAFVAPNAGDYHIRPESAALDAGIDAGVLYDIDGDARPFGDGYDVGADEWVVTYNAAPYVPADPNPAGGALDVPLDAMLSWMGGDPDGGPVTYTVAFGDEDPPPERADVLTTMYDPGALRPATRYYWVVTATDGLSTSVGPMWSFSTVPPNRAPHTPASPSPDNGAEDVPLDTMLSWTGGDPDGGPVTYTVALANRAGGPISVTSVLTTHLDPGALAPSTGYTWQVTATDGLSTSVGPMWTFTTTFAAELALTPGRSGAAAPGTLVTYTHTVTQLGSIADLVTLTAANSRGWTVTLRGGAWPMGSVQLPLPLLPGASAVITATVAIPPTATPGLTATTTITATSGNDPATYVTALDVTTVLSAKRHVFLPLVLREAP